MHPLLYNKTFLLGKSFSEKGKDKSLFQLNQNLIWILYLVREHLIYWQIKKT